MDTLSFQTLLFDRAGKPNSAPFKDRPDLTAALVEAGANPSSIGSKLTRLFANGEFSIPMMELVLRVANDRLTRIEEPPRREEVRSGLAPGFEALRTERAAERYKPSDDSLLRTVIERAKSAKSVLRIEPFVRIRSGTMGSVIPPEVDDRLQLNCFPSPSLAVKWVCDQVRNKIDPVLLNANDRQTEFVRATAEKTLKLLVEKQKNETFQIKILESSACTVQVRVTDYLADSPLFRVFTWMYDDQGRIVNPADVLEPYLKAWQDFVFRIRMNDVCLVAQGRFELEEHCDAMISEIVAQPTASTDRGFVMRSGPNA
jgi:hypothetical protein